MDVRFPNLAEATELRQRTGEARWKALREFICASDKAGRVIGEAYEKACREMAPVLLAEARRVREQLEAIGKSISNAARSAPEKLSGEESSMNLLAEFYREVAKINGMTDEELLETVNRPPRVIEEFDAAPSFPAPDGEPCYPTAIDNDGVRYFAPLLAHRKAIEVRVGGIPWNKVPGMPARGEWGQDMFRGVIQLGGITLGGRVIAYLER